MRDVLTALRWALGEVMRDMVNLALPIIFGAWSVGYWAEYLAEGGAWKSVLGTVFGVLALKLSGDALAVIVSNTKEAEKRRNDRIDKAYYEALDAAYKAKDRAAKTRKF